MIAISLGLRGGFADAKAGNPRYLFGLFFRTGRRKELFRSELAAIRNLLAMGIVMDIVFQLILYRSVHPGAAIMIGPILICFPMQSPNLQSADQPRDAGNGKDVSNAAFLRDRNCGGRIKHETLAQASCHLRNQYVGVVVRVEPKIQKAGESRHSQRKSGTLWLPMDLTPSGSWGCGNAALPGLKSPCEIKDSSRISREPLPDAPEDNVGSPYCVRRYVVDQHPGGPEGHE